MERPRLAPSGDVIGTEMGQLRSIENALADLRKKQQSNPTTRLARMIQLLEAEIRERVPRGGATL